MKKFVSRFLLVSGLLSVCALVGYADQKYPVNYQDEKGKTFQAAEVLVSTSTGKFSVNVNEKLIKKQWIQVMQESITRNVLYAQRDGVITNELNALLKMLVPAQAQQDKK